MRIPLSILPRMGEAGLMLDVLYEDQHQCVGPVQQGQAIILVFDAAQADLPPMRRPPTKQEVELSTRDEEEVAVLVGGKRHKGSGNNPHHKGDGRKRGVLRYESKTTRGKQYLVTLDELNKIRQECSMDEKPAFVVTFRERRTRRKLDRWVLLPFEDWHEVHNNR